MNRWIVRLAAMLLALAGAMPALATGGRLIDLPPIAASGLPVQRVTVWLPPGYDRGRRRYPVIYMQDGQNLFRPGSAVFGTAWAADRAMLVAMRRSRVPAHIIVGVWAPGSDRWRQYLPDEVHESASPALKAALERQAGGAIVSSAYLAWLAGPLKARIDAGFRTLPDRDHTAVAGSSMGGLVSCAAFLRYPAVYGRAACISSHWPATDPRVIGPANRELIAFWDGWFARRLGAPRGRRLWLDHGTATLDAAYAPYQKVVDRRIAAMGWREGRDWRSRVFDGAAHDEASWAARLPDIFAWLLRP